MRVTTGQPKVREREKKTWTGIRSVRYVLESYLDAQLPTSLNKLILFSSVYFDALLQVIFFFASLSISEVFFLFPSQGVKSMKTDLMCVFFFSSLSHISYMLFFFFCLFRSEYTSVNILQIKAQIAFISCLQKVKKRKETYRM